MDAQNTYLAVDKVSKHFGRFAALQEVSFTAERGEFLCILGPSGCGKTTLLRLIAGLEAQSAGRVLIDRRDVSDYPVSRRNVGIVFQSYALFPNLSARNNIAYGLKSGRGNGRGEITARVDQLLDLVGLRGMGRKYPAQLSGGQQQRVALARALAVSPGLLLLDEPLSALDAKVRLLLRGEIRQLQKRLGVTTVMVTHDQEEALTMADRILIIDRGRLVQDGTPHDVYDRPATPFVASFIGAMNFIPDAVKESDGIYGLGGHRLQVGLENGSAALPRGARVTIAIRPEDVMIGREPARGNMLPTRVMSMEYRGSQFRLSLSVHSDQREGVRIDADVPTEKVRRLEIRPEMNLPVHLPLNRLRVYSNGEGHA
jgi:iron(III) transport system ATP-binding protein